MEDNPTSSDVSPVTGQTQIDPADFLAEEEQVMEDTSEASADQTTATAPETQETETGEETEQVAEEAPILAGKFKSEVALRDAFTELGGNPDEYSDPKMLEEAYKVREREFTRVRQQTADLAKGEESQDQTTTQPDRVSEIVSNIDWSKITNYNDLVTETLNLSDQMYQGREAEMVQKVISAVETREQRGKELTEVEADVPRLTTDTEFRASFAHYVVGLKAAGQYHNLKQTMQGFLAIGQKITEEVAKQKQSQESAKASAQSAEAKADNKQAQSAATDELDGIVDAYLERRNLFG